MDAAVRRSERGQIQFFSGLLSPFARVAARLREGGSPLPAWFSLVFTLGVGIVALLLAAKGLRLLGGAFRS